MRGAGKAVGCKRDRPTEQILRRLEHRTVPADNRQPRPQVEVAVMEDAIPGHGEAASTGEKRDSRGVELRAKRLEVCLQGLCRDETGPKPPDGNVGEHAQLVEPDAVLLEELASKPRHFFFGIRQAGPVRVRGEVEDKAVAEAVAQGIEPPEHGDTFLERRGAALTLDGRGVPRRQRRQEAHPVSGEHLGHVAVPGLEHRGQVGSNLDFEVGGAGLQDEIPYPGMQLWSPTGQIEHRPPEA